MTTDFNGPYRCLTSIGASGVDMDLLMAKQGRDLASVSKPARRNSRRKAPKETATRSRKNIGSFSENRSSKHGHSSQIGSENSFPIVGIGASAGGLEAFTRLLKSLPADTGMGFVLVQHLDPIHKSALPSLLSKATSMPVREVTHNTRVQPNQVYVIAPNTRLTIEAGVLKLLPRKTTDGQHRPIDQFYQSLAEDQGGRAISVILSGTASDGTLGCGAIKAEGGITFAQDDSAKYDSMPRSAIAAGCIDFVLSPEEIAKELARIAHHPYVKSDILHKAIALKEVEEGAREITEHSRRKIPGATADPYRTILTLLRTRTGIDFSLYKPNTIRRRIGRRMVLSKLKSLNAYCYRLKNDAKEVESLYQDILISVTGFFRNPEAFELLKKSVFPKLLKGRSPDESIRVWVPGCSTGQEAYSIAMALLEYTSQANRNVPVQVFATDLNEAPLDKARSGLYTNMLVSEVTPERLRRFFVKEDGGYRISKAVREICVFAQQNLLTDPPFSRMDLISCRNLLIYLESGSHRRILPTFHYALKPNGFLFLGASETVGTDTDLFATVDKKYRIYSRKPAATRPLNLSLPSGVPPRESGKPSRELMSLREGLELEAQKEADRITLSNYGPAGVLINADLEVLQFRGMTGAYLEPAPGRASFSLLKMAREGLFSPLRTAINRAKREKQRVRKDNIKIDLDGQTRTASIDVIPLRNIKGECYLVLFESADDAQTKKTRIDLRSKGSRAAKGKASADTAENQAREILELKRELAEMRDYMQSVLEKHEAATEELQASNEEVQSTNEELQSLNEEMETSKEELESTNEELITVNEEVQNRNRELDRANNDLNNLYDSISLSIVLLARDLTIRRFNARAERELNLLTNDIGQSIRRIRTNLDHADLETIALEVIRDLRTYETETQDKTGRWYSLRVSPYLTPEDKIDGAVIALVDIDALKRAETTSSHFAALVQSSDDAIISKSLEGIILTWNGGAERMFGYPAEETVGQPIQMLLPPDRVDEERVILDKVKRGESINHLETVRMAKDGHLIDTLLTVSPIKTKDGTITAGSTIAHDITERKRGERELEQSLLNEKASRAEAQAANQVKDEFLAMVSHELRTPLNAITGWAQLLAKGNLDAANVQKATSSIIRSARNQATIIGDLLDTSRIISRKLQLNREPVNIRDVINAAVEGIRSAAEQKKIHLAINLKGKSSRIDGDPTRLEQALGNVLSNAVKFTPEQGRIEVRMRLAGDQVVISVKDNGDGISPEFLPHIFERFKQADGSEKRGKGGLGLGLAIAQQLLEMHAGSIECESDGIGKGASFTITLPTLPAIVEEAAERETASKFAVDETISESLPHEILKGLKVLVVDDQPDTRDVVSLALEDYGAKVKLCASAEDGVESVLQWKPDVIVSDIGMPGVDGYQLMNQIRALKGQNGAKTPAVALTGYVSDQDESRAIGAGFNAHLGKPVSLEELVRTVAELSKRL